MESQGGLRPGEGRQVAQQITRLGSHGDRDRQRCRSSQLDPRRQRFEGKHPSNFWARAVTSESPRIGYAPSEYRTKPWPHEALIEGWFPPYGRGQSGFQVEGSCEGCWLPKRSPGASVRRTHVGLRRSEDDPRTGVDAGWKKDEFVRRRATSFLDIPFHRRNFDRGFGEGSRRVG